MNILPIENPPNVQIVIANLDTIELTPDELSQLLRSGKVSLQCSLNASTDDKVILQLDKVKVWK